MKLNYFLALVLISQGTFVGIALSDENEDPVRGSITLRTDTSERTIDLERCTGSLKMTHLSSKTSIAYKIRKGADHLISSLTIPKAIVDSDVVFPKKISLSKITPEYSLVELALDEGEGIRLNLGTIAQKYFKVRKKLYRVTQEIEMRITTNFVGTTTSKVKVKEKNGKISIDSLVRFDQDERGFLLSGELVELIDSDLDDDPREETVGQYGIPREDLSRYEFKAKLTCTSPESTD